MAARISASKGEAETEAPLEAELGVCEVKPAAAEGVEAVEDAEVCGESTGSSGANTAGGGEDTVRPLAEGAASGLT